MMIFRFIKNLLNNWKMIFQESKTNYLSSMNKSVFYIVMKSTLIRKYDSTLFSYILIFLLQLIEQHQSLGRLWTNYKYFLDESLNSFKRLKVFEQFLFISLLTYDFIRRKHLNFDYRRNKNKPSLISMNSKDPFIYQVRIVLKYRYWQHW